MKINNSMFTQGYTSVHREGETFTVKKADDGTELTTVHFQDGPIKEVGINGIQNEDLLLMIITRLEGFQNSEYACVENEKALESLYSATTWLRRRTHNREVKGVEGTSRV